MFVRWRLWGEFILVFALPPLVLSWIGHRLLAAASLWAGALVTHHLMRRGSPLSVLSVEPGAFSPRVRAVFVRFLLLSGPLVALTLILVPEYFLFLPRKAPELWLRIMLFYPILSVWPQEIIYRRFLLHRYHPLFGDGPRYLMASAVAFGFAHIMFNNAVALILSALGGALFANTYRQSRALSLVCLEHALYGCLIFTIGLGRFFYIGTVWSR